MLGSSKLSVGPSFIVNYTKIKNLQIGALKQQFYFFSSDKDRRKQNIMHFQPLITKVLPNGFFLQFAPIMRFNWERGIYTVPVDLLFGKAFAQNLSISLGPEVIVTGPFKGDFTVRVNVNAMFAQ